MSTACDNFGMMGAHLPVNPFEALAAERESNQLAVRFACLTCACTTYASLTRLSASVWGYADVLDNKLFCSPLGTSWHYTYSQLTRFAFDYIQSHGSIVLRRTP